MNNSSKQTIDPQLAEILACPVCKSVVKLEEIVLVCASDECKPRFPIVAGIPMMLPSELKAEGFEERGV